MKDSLWIGLTIFVAIAFTMTGFLHGVSIMENRSIRHYQCKNDPMHKVYVNYASDNWVYKEVDQIEGWKTVKSGTKEEITKICEVVW